MNDWSNQNLKGFYVVTAHLVDIKTLSPKSILFTILDVKCGTGVGRRVGTPLFEHLKGMGTGVLTRFLNVVSDNGFDAIVAVRRLFQLINASVGFEQIPNFNHVMQNLAADHKPTLNMLPLSIVHLVKHCETSELQLSAINSRITLTGMQEKIEEYVKLLVLEPAIVAAYLNTQIAKPSDPMELKKLKDLIRSTLQRRYSVELQFRNSTVESEEPINSIFQALFQPHSDNSMLDEMDAKILKVSGNRAITAAIGSTNKDNPTDEIEDVVNQLKIVQDNWYKEVFDDGVVYMLNSQFEEMVFESNLN
ncbi:hypothetical protein AXG93_1099s1170 [Marchantia polymorpha subsp. ruderalis]|uniref:Uncharacterized protein n=1 Tax=Marchantia polymorpha subsp. ruderalis TaxID=1480154 RepID=A0A176WM77_MARPO|nr:hypothetical protein AXG93_1099s1170 [Marchantia polymorpha subsp. ruderalis]